MARPRHFIGAAAAAVVVCGATGMLAACGRDDPTPSPRSGRVERDLRALGYTGWDPAIDEGAGVVYRDRMRASDLARVWADDRSTVYSVSPDGAPLARLEVPGRTQVEFARVLNDGRVLCVSVDEGLTLLEASGDVVWSLDIPAHHEAVAVPDGSAPGERTFACLTHRAVPHRGRSVRFDAVEFVAEATGERVEGPYRRYDTYDHRATLDATRPGVRHPLDVPPPAQGGSRDEATYDYFHANGIAFRSADEMFVCLRNVDMIVSVDARTGEMLGSYGHGILDWPHAPTIVQHDGIDRLLVFDNGKHRGWSRVVEIELGSGALAWSWPKGRESRAGDEAPRLWSELRGYAQRLPGGTTLVTESERGRAIEVTRSGEVVWEFLNPERREGPNGPERRRIYRMTAVPTDRF